MSDENTEVEATEEAPKIDKRARWITTPDGETVNRTEYIRKLWATGDWDRSMITAHINDECTSENGENSIAYQIVFAATKDQPGGPSAEFLAKKEAEKEAKKAAKAAKAAKKKDESVDGEADADADEEADDVDEDEVNY